MDCDHALEHLTAGVDTPLDASEQRALDAHLVACPACVEALHEHIVAREALRETSPSPHGYAPLPDAVVRDIVAAMRSVRASPATGGTKSA